MSAKKTPEWAQPLIDRLPETPLSENGLIEFIDSYIKDRNQTETGKNSNGEYIRYSNGEQVCKGPFEVRPNSQDAQATVVFPARFESTPSVDLSGDVSRLKSKSSNTSTMSVSFDMRGLKRSLEFEYQARGLWASI